MTPTFHTETALAGGLRDLFRLLEVRLSLHSPVNVYLAGGMAVYLYTASRVSTDVDAEFGSRSSPTTTRTTLPRWCGSAWRVPTTSNNAPTAP